MTLPDELPAEPLRLLIARLVEERIATGAVDPARATYGGAALFADVGVSQRSWYAIRDRDAVPFDLADTVVTRLGSTLDAVYPDLADSADVVEVPLARRPCHDRPGARRVARLLERVPRDARRPRLATPHRGGDGVTSTLYSVACRIHGAGKEPFVLEVCCHAEDAAAACVIATRRAADHAAGIRRPRVFSERWARRDTSHVQVAILSVSTLDDCVVDEDDVAAPVVDGQLDIFDVIAGGSGNAT